MAETNAERSSTKFVRDAIRLADSKYFITESITIHTFQEILADLEKLEAVERQRDAFASFTRYVVKQCLEEFDGEDWPAGMDVDLPRGA